MNPTNLDQVYIELFPIEWLFNHLTAAIDVRAIYYSIVHAFTANQEGVQHAEMNRANRGNCVK